MSQSIRVYATHIATVRAAIGSGDLSVVERIEGDVDRALDLDEIDDVFETGEDHGPGLSAREALAELIHGELSLDPDEGEDLYSQVFVVLCNGFGGWLLDDRLNQCDVDWLTRLDGLLRSGGVPLELSTLWCRAGVAGNAAVDSVLDVGFWKAEEVSAARPSLDALVPTVTNAEDRDALEAIRQWCETLTEYPECVLLGSFG